jgi:type II secretory pathway pseudopilin PulG
MCLLSNSRIQPHAGFTYIGLLMLLAIIALVASTSLQVGSILQRRAAEEELLTIGLEFRQALQSYAAFSQAGQKRYPSTLADLVKDPRFPHTVRHLRKVYVDPLTGKDEWGVVTAVDGTGILALYSLSKDTPIKVGNFDAVWQGFEASDSYQRWRFSAAALMPLPKANPNQPNNLPSKSADENYAEANRVNREKMNQLNQADADGDAHRP